jgi:putative transposon-encoded protein
MQVQKVEFDEADDVEAMLEKKVSEFGATVCLWLN